MDIERQFREPSWSTSVFRYPEDTFDSRSVFVKWLEDYLLNTSLFLSKYTINPIFYWHRLSYSRFDLEIFQVRIFMGSDIDGRQREAIMTQRPKFSIGYYLTIFLLIMFLESMFFSGPAVKELPYSKFQDLIQKQGQNL